MAKKAKRKKRKTMKKEMNMNFDREDFEGMLEKVIDETLTVAEILDAFNAVREFSISMLDSKKTEVTKIWKDNGSPCDAAFLAQIREVSIKITGDTVNADVSVALGWIAMQANDEIRQTNFHLIMDIHKLMGQLEMLDNLAKAFVLGAIMENVPEGSPSGATTLH